MRSANDADYKPTKSWRQSSQPNTSGTSLHHQQDIHDIISDDLSAGFPDGFYMDFNNGVPLMTSQEDPLALDSTMDGWQDFLTFDPTLPGWEDPMAYDPTMGGWQDLPAFDPTMGAWQYSSTESSRASSVSANSRPFAKDDVTQESFICNDECCHGRAFSSRANLRRHQNERKGLRRVYACSFCHRVFSRSTAVRLHQQNGVCFKSNGATQ
ncbi:uncharacterized protein FIESC28_09115 [Fusarium coffeatum]|uniref:C2H2-type domain-containing protein n=1 Tax=Fusarium coffeatum TaxID=231269 RepID=A0A366R277_9HYPO|nr:uncharacterized protein FIESC28_09115 [Fusarium coffeatum]RBR11231.1 hypothetical protein FIESC28_09115 [Fusarium coffeatum]